MPSSRSLPRKAKTCCTQYGRAANQERKSTIKRLIGSGNEGILKAFAQGLQLRTSFTQQASGLQPLPSHIPHCSHLLHELGRCCQQNWQRYLLPRRRTIYVRGLSQMLDSEWLRSVELNNGKLQKSNKLLFKEIDFRPLCSESPKSSEIIACDIFIYNVLV